MYSPREFLTVFNDYGTNGAGKISFIQTIGLNLTVSEVRSFKGIKILSEQGSWLYHGFCKIHVTLSSVSATRKNHEKR